jgi:hypothetical protein
MLPVVLKPELDERLSCWLGRLAQLYGMPIEAFLECCGLPRRDVINLEWRLGGGEGALLAARVGMAVEELRAMTFADIMPHARLMVARGRRYVCPLCRGGTQHKATALPWSFWCREHAVRLVARGGRELERLPETQLVMLDLNARAGARRLANWARGRDEGLPSIPQLLEFLTARHRRSSPPSLAEQPRLSLEARRANHDFLTRPIARQALLVVVPEYDRVAPVLAKPVRTGLFSLAQGSLLQNYALAVGIGRLSADPVGYGAAVLLASDREGEERLRATLRAWPLTLRRRIYARLGRLRGAHSGTASGVERTLSGRKRGQSQKFRFSQSHNHAPRIS